MRFGFREEDVLDCDLASFGARLRSAQRVLAQEKLEAAWTAMYAAQGEHKQMVEWTKPWEDQLAGRREKKGGAGRLTGEDLKRRIRGGF